MLSDLFVLAFLLAMSAFFSGTETAFTALTPYQIRNLEEKKGRLGRLVSQMTGKPNVLLTTLLIGNNLANIGATALATALTINLFGSHAVGYMTGGLTLFILIFGEVTPKQIALAKNERICLIMILPIYLLSKLFFPIIWVVSLISSFLTRLFTGGQGEKHFTLENLLQMVSLGENIGIVEDYEKEMVQKIFRFNGITVKGITTHRQDLFCLDKDSLVEEVLEEILEKNFSRIPLYSETPENIVGLVLSQDILTGLARGERGFRLKEKMINPYFIPETRMVYDLFSQMKVDKVNLAVVLDEYGGLQGIVTKEDVIEEIFGELYDEYEEVGEEKVVGTNGGRDWIIQGDATFFDLKDHLGLELEHDARTLTISGYLTERWGELPREGESLTLPEGKYTILKTTKNRIEEIRFRPADSPA